MTVFKDRAQETSSNTPASGGAISITLNGATTYNRTFAGAGYVNADAVLVHVWQTSNPALWCVVPGQFVDTPDRITFAATDIEDGSEGPGVSPTWTGTVTVGVEMVASLAAAASGAEPAGTAAAAITAHDTTTAHAGIVAAQTTAATSKATPVDADEIPLADSAASFALKKLTWANLKTVLGSTFAAIGNWVEEASNVVARRNGTNAQSLRLYNTYTDASNYERLTLTGTAGSSVELKAESAGTGAANIDFRITPKGSGRLLIGVNAGTSATSNLMAIGFEAGKNSTSASNATAIGDYAGRGATTGSQWVAVGVNAGYSNTTGGGYLALGVNAGYSNTTGTQWTAIGRQAGMNNTTSNNWTAIGFDAARNLPDGSSAAQTYANSTYIGAYTRVSANGVTNETAIGYLAVGSGSNTVTIGNSSVTANYFTGIIDTTGDKLRLRTAKTPSSAADTGNQGDICWDSSYLYVCTAANTWKRVALSTW